MKRLLFMLLLGANLYAKNNVGCPQIDPLKKYPDQIPYCPELVKENAFTVTRCAFDQANKWHKATEPEKNTMSQLVVALKAQDAPTIIASSGKLKLQVCRSQKDSDSFLLLYTKPGVRDYSGPFLMFREGGKTSGLIIHAPHDGQDGTPRSTRDAFQNSNALALISNGHERTLSGRKQTRNGSAFPSDWAHTSTDLGYHAFTALKNQFPDSVHVHIHGLAKNDVLVTDSVGWKSQHIFRTAVIDASKKALIGNKAVEVKEWRFNGWITGIAMTRNENGRGRMDNEKWVGMEVSVRLHANTNFVTKMIRNIEEDYLKKPRPITKDLETPVPDDPNDVVNPVDEEAEPTPPEDPAVPPLPEEIEIDDQEDAEAPHECSSEEEAVLVPETKATVKRPPMRVLKGKRDLLCIGVKYSTGEISATKPSCVNLADNIKEFWARNSRTGLQIQPRGEEPFESGLPGAKGPGGWKQARRSYTQSVEMIKKAYPGQDYYVIPGIYTHPHAGNKVAHVKSVQAMTAQHEVGHLLGLGHAGSYTYPGGKPSLNAYGDTDSIMGRVISKYITAPQYYYLGWLKPEEIADFNKATPHYDLGKIAEWKGLQTVIVPPSAYGDGKGRWVFVSSTRCTGNKSPGCIAIHFSTGGGSQKILEVVEEGWDTHFTGLHVKKLQNLPGKIRVKIDFEPKPAVKK